MLRLALSMILILTQVQAWGAPKPAKRAPSSKLESKKRVRVANPVIRRTANELGDSLEQVSSFRLTNTVTLNIDEATQLAIRNNTQIKSANLNCEAASNTFWAEHYDYYFPSLTMEAQNAHRNVVNSLLLTDSLAITDTAAVSLTGVVPWVGLEYTLTPVALTRVRDRSFGESHVAQYQATLELPLLRNFGPAISDTVIDRAELDFDASKLSCKSTMLKVVTDVRIAFWDLLFSTRSLSIQQDSLKAAAAFVDETKTRIKNGLLPEVELANSLANYYSRQSELLNSEQQLIQSQQRFKQLLGMSSSSKWYLPSEEELDQEVPRPADLDPKSALEQALKERPDYQSALKGVRVSELNEEYDSNQRYPELALFGTTLAEHQGSGNRDTVVGVRFSMALPNVQAQASYKNRVLERTSKQLELKQLRESIQEEVLSNISVLKQSYQQIRSARLAAQLSRKKLETEVVKFQLGQQSQKNVVDFQRDLAAARLTELQAYTAYRKALISLYTAMGVIKNK